MGFQRRTLRQRLMDKCLLEWGPGKRGAWGWGGDRNCCAIRPPSGQAGQVPLDPPTPASLAGLLPGGGRGVGDVMDSLALLATHRQRNSGSKRQPQAKGPSCWQLAARALRQLRRGNSGSAERATQTQTTLWLRVGRRGSVTPGWVASGKLLSLSEPQFPLL